MCYLLLAMQVRAAYLIGQEASPGLMAAHLDGLAAAGVGRCRNAPARTWPPIVLFAVIGEPSWQLGGQGILHRA